MMTSKYLALSTTFLLLLCSVLQHQVEGSSSQERERLINDLISRKHNLVRPDGADGKGSPVLVDISVHLIKIWDVTSRERMGVRHGYMKSTAYLGLSWTDPRLTYRNHNITDVRLDISNIWTPDIEPYDSDLPTMQSLTRQNLAVLYQEGSVLWAPNVLVGSFCAPAADSALNCTFTMGSWTHSGLNLDLRRVDISGNEGNMTDPSGQWTLVSTSARRMVKKYICCPESYVSASFSAILQHTGQ